MTTIRQQLTRAAERAQFTTQDLATWLEYRYSTVQYWVAGNTTPQPLKRHHIAARLLLLERVLKHHNSGLPVPPSVTQYERKAYIERVRDRALKGIFGMGAAE